MDYTERRTGLFWPHITVNALQCFHSASIVSLD